MFMFDPDAILSATLAGSFMAVAFIGSAHFQRTLRITKARKQRQQAVQMLRRLKPERIPG